MFKCWIRSTGVKVKVKVYSFNKCRVGGMCARWGGLVVWFFAFCRPPRLGPQIRWIVKATDNCTVLYLTVLYSVRQSTVLGAPVPSRVPRVQRMKQAATNLPL